MCDTLAQALAISQDTVPNGQRVLVHRYPLTAPCDHVNAPDCWCQPLSFEASEPIDCVVAQAALLGSMAYMSRVAGRA